MTVHITPLRHWVSVHVRRHIPFALYTAGTVLCMGWVAWNLIRLG
jgi:hypothetical protein